VGGQARRGSRGLSNVSSRARRSCSPGPGAERWLDSFTGLRTGTLPRRTRPLPTTSDSDCDTAARYLRHLLVAGGRPQARHLTCPSASSLPDRGSCPSPRCTPSRRVRRTPAPRLTRQLPRPGRSGQAAPVNDRASAGPTTRSWRSPPTSSRPDCSRPPAFTGSKPAVRISRATSSPARSSSVT
jgi:hypothetical protein